jgi:hypothetical protein
MKKKTMKKTTGNPQIDAGRDYLDNNPRRPAQPQRRNPNRIGALWINRKGQNTFMSGELEIPETGERLRILVFKKTYKETANQPDYNIMLPREPRRTDEIDDGDIPF